MAFQILPIAAISFIIGFTAGFYAAGALDGTSQKEVRLYISLLISVMWATSVIAGIIVPTHAPSLALHGIMGAVAGYFFKTANPIKNQSKEK